MRFSKFVEKFGRNKCVKPSAILTLENGVTITQEEGRHAEVNGAVCNCGDLLYVAPAVFGPDHKKGDPVVICTDHGHNAYHFKELVPGKQPETEEQDA